MITDVRLTDVVEFKCGFIDSNPSARIEVVELFRDMLDNIDKGSDVNDQISLFKSNCQDILVEI